MDSSGVGVGGVDNRADAFFSGKSDDSLFVKASFPPGDPGMVADREGNVGRRRDEDLVARRGKAFGKGRRFARPADEEDHTSYPLGVTNHSAIRFVERPPMITTLRMAIGSSRKRSRSERRICSSGEPIAVPIPTGVVPGRWRRKMAAASSSWRVRFCDRGL